MYKYSPHIKLNLSEHRVLNLNSPVLIQFLFSFVNNQAMVFLCVPNTLYAFIISKQVFDVIRNFLLIPEESLGTTTTRFFDRINSKNIYKQCGLHELPLP